MREIIWIIISFVLFPALHIFYETSSFQLHL